MRKGVPLANHYLKLDALLIQMCPRRRSVRKRQSLAVLLYKYNLAIDFFNLNMPLYRPLLFEYRRGTKFRGSRLLFCVSL